MRIAIGIEYDGSFYQGWQTQPNRLAVQDYMQSALQKIALHPIELHAAGRTDSGVHALMQVAHFDTQTLRPIDAWVRGVNRFLPAQIRVLWATQTADHFHARHSAQTRHYQYLLLNRRICSAVRFQKVGWFHLPLNIHLMQEGIQHFLGEHDFSAFRASECQAISPVRTMLEAEVKQVGDYFLFDFVANAFLHHQVRNMVGALIYVGKSSLEPSAISQLLKNKDRRLVPPTFSPDGLYLTGVTYDASWQLPNTNTALTI